MAAAVLRREGGVAQGVGGATGLAIIGVMKTKSLEILEKAELPPAQARAILQVMESELVTETLATKADLAAFVTKSEFEVGIERLRSEIASAEYRVIRWVLTSMMGLGATILGALYFAVTHLRR